MKIRRFKFALAVILLTGHGAFAIEPSPTAPQLRAELLAMEVIDQEVRNSTTPDYQRWSEVDAKNGRRLKEIVDQFGWPTFAMVGEDGANAAWLLAQHADRDPEFQNKVLALMTPLVEQGQASAKLHAYLHDRTHGPQRFGTQGRCVSDGRWEPFEIENAAEVAARRRKVGLPTMEEYVAMMNAVCQGVEVKAK